MDTQLRRHAIQRIRARQQFHLHVAFYLAMSVYLVYLWSRSDADVFWPIWALVGWGMGLASHGLHVYGWEHRISEERIQREIERTS